MIAKEQKDHVEMFLHESVFNLNIEKKTSFHQHSSLYINFLLKMGCTFSNPRDKYCRSTSLSSNSSRRRISSVNISRNAREFSNFWRSGGSFKVQSRRKQTTRRHPRR
ncbi:Tetratricopeptide repeat protein [Trichinella pseudospiralis]